MFTSLPLDPIRSQMDQGHTFKCIVVACAHTVLSYGLTECEFLAYEDSDKLHMF
jgi:hypothetical protein